MGQGAGSGRATDVMWLLRCPRDTAKESHRERQTTERDAGVGELADAVEDVCLTDGRGQTESVLSVTLRSLDSRGLRDSHPLCTRFSKLRSAPACLRAATSDTATATVSTRFFIGFSVFSVPPSQHRYSTGV